MSDIFFPTRPRRDNPQGYLVVQENLDNLASLFKKGTSPGQIPVWDGSKWVPQSQQNFLGEWTNYVPTWTVASGTAPSIGNGTMNIRYLVVGKLCICQFSFTAGSTTTFGSGGAFRWSLPLTASSNAIGRNGSAKCVNSGALAFHAEVDLVNTTTFEIVTYNLVAANMATLNAIFNTVPFTWGDQDWMQAMFSYELP